MCQKCCRELSELNKIKRNYKEISKKICVLACLPRSDSCWAQCYDKTSSPIIEKRCFVELRSIHLLKLSALGENNKLFNLATPFILVVLQNSIKFLFFFLEIRESLVEKFIYTIFFKSYLYNRINLIIVSNNVNYPYSKLCLKSFESGKPQISFLNFFSFILWSI